MRKRSKKRTPQDIKPWIGVKSQDTDVFVLPGKKTTRWVAGGRRDWNTRVLNAANNQEIKKVMLSAIIRSMSTDTGVFANLAAQKIINKLQGANKTASMTRYKNFCLVSGRGRTYNRSLYLARHNMRKLVGLGVISGLNK